MASKTPLSIPSPYGKDSISLASLIPDKNHPNEDAIGKVDVQRGEDYTVDVDLGFSQLVQTTSDSSVKLAVGRLFSITGEGDREQEYDVKADHGLIYELRQPSAIFAKLCEDEGVQKWLEKRYIGEKKSYFIIGYHTLCNAKVSRRQSHSSVAAGSAKFPAGAATGADPTPTGELDIEAAARQASGMKKDEVVENLGERIFHIKYRKVKLDFFKKGRDPPKVCESRWVSTLARRGKSQDEMVAASLVEDDLE